ncbi:MAG TPA: hypothetical protein VG325_06625 [Solirubrobacteraceae bacterium]|nr:hypothetical protein [Solirubrobacteraceae bacterium]
MSEFDNFEDRLRAMADEISRSVQRFSEADLGELAEQYGIDADRARTFADAAGRWLGDRLSGVEPLFGEDRRGDQGSTPGGVAADLDSRVTRAGSASSSSTPGPHPLDLPTGRQGLALSALDSGRWTVGPGSNQLVGSGEGPPPPGAPDLVSELRGRDWITAEGTLTLVGRHALARWCRAAEDVPQPTPPPDASSS